MNKKLGKPVSKLVPIEEKLKKPTFGFLRDSVTVKSDIIESMDEKWNAMRRRSR